MTSRKKTAPQPAKKSQDEYADSGPTNPDQMSAEVIEFITAIDEYKRKHARKFPTWSEILDVVKSLGYSRTDV